MNSKKTAFVSDFDGTITDDDFFTYVVTQYMDYEALNPWREYLAGKRSHFDALKEIFSHIHVEEEELISLIRSIKVDSRLKDVWRLCSDRDVPLYVCSAGTDYYIKLLIGPLMDKYNVTLVSNIGSYDRDKGLSMIAPPMDDPYYDQNVGISKKKLVGRLKEEGYSVIFAGDGPPDIEPAKIADVVFARKLLLEKCREEGVRTRVLNGFKDIYEFIEEFA